MTLMMLHLLLWITRVLSGTVPGFSGDGDRHLPVAHSSSFGLDHSVESDPFLLRRDLTSASSSSTSLSREPVSFSASSSTGIDATLSTTSRSNSVASISSTAVPQVFNPLAANNLAVYIGHSPGNFNASLPALCNDTTINIIMIAFIRAFNGPNLLPTFDFAPKCDSRPVTNYSAPFSCPLLAEQISSCQAQGKKIFVSIGGSSSNTTFNSSQAATSAANTLWNIFGSGIAAPALRPFGNVTVDGFDVDQESGPAQYYDIFASTLRNLYATDSKQYFLSAAPLCANTTALPAAFYAQTDFVYVRFYNARKCNVGTSGFIPTLRSWDRYLSSVASSSTSPFPRLYVGGLSFDNGNSGYIPPANFSAAVQQAAVAAQDRFGGVMCWDGTNAQATLDASGQTFAAVVKRGMAGNSARVPGGTGCEE